MKNTLKVLLVIFSLSLLLACSRNDTSQFTGRYAFKDENEFDYIRDTILIEDNDKGNFDVSFIRWSSAKQDDPLRPINKIAGQWNRGNVTTYQAELQQSDHTLRITEPITGRLSTISFNASFGSLTYTSFKGHQTVYQKIVP